MSKKNTKIGTGASKQGSARKPIALGNWVNNLHSDPVKVKDMSKLIPIKIDRRTTIYVHPLNKERLEEIKKKYDYIKIPENFC